MTGQDLKSIIEAYGWVRIDSKNPFMDSWRNTAESARLNYYFTTSTMTVQTRSGKMFTYRAMITMELIEDALTNVKKHL